MPSHFCPEVFNRHFGQPLFDGGRRPARHPQLIRLVEDRRDQLAQFRIQFLHVVDGNARPLRHALPAGSVPAKRLAAVPIPRPRYVATSPAVDSPA